MNIDNIIYIIFSLAKTGTTSILNMCLDNNIFPLIYTHDFEYLHIYINKKNNNFILNIPQHFIINKNEINNDIQYLYIQPKNEINLFLQLLKNYKIKIISGIRNPLHRRISQFLYSIYKFSSDLLKLHDTVNFNDIIKCIDNNDHIIYSDIQIYIINILKNTNHLLDNETCLDIFKKNYFSDEEPWDYKLFFGILFNILKFNINKNFLLFKSKKKYEIYNYDTLYDNFTLSIEHYFYQLEYIDNNLFKFLNISKNTIIKKDNVLNNIILCENSYNDIKKFILKNINNDKIIDNYLPLEIYKNK